MAGVAGKWHQLRGFEGLYEVTADGMKVRSCARTWRFGTGKKTTRSKILTRRKEGGFVLKKNGEARLFHPHQLLGLIGDEVTND